MNTSKIQLSPDEMKLVTNSEWILTKHRVIEKVYQLFGSVSEEMQMHIRSEMHTVPTEALQLSPKISKGEQYEAMPYVVLDYPRLFSKQDVFAIRSFFWWGNYFSITMHLKGKYKEQWYKKIEAALKEKKLKDFYFSFSGNEFSFDLNNRNYFTDETMNDFSANEIQHAPFIKISYKISFAEWNTANKKLMKAFKLFAEI